MLVQVQPVYTGIRRTECSGRRRVQHQRPVLSVPSHLLPQRHHIHGLFASILCAANSLTKGRYTLPVFTGRV